jgi:hypothetical protein
MNAYETHLQSAHFKEYKITTEKMAKSLKLVRTGSAWRKGKVMSMFHLHRLFQIILVAAFASSNALASEARGLVTIGMQRVLNT